MPRFPLRRLTVDMCAPVLAEDMVVEVQQARVGANGGFFYIACLQKERLWLMWQFVEANVSGILINTPSLCHNVTFQPFHRFHKSLMPKFTQHFGIIIIGAFPFSRSRDLSVVVGSF